MKDILSAVLAVVVLVCGSGFALKAFHNTVREAALEKAAKGLPSLSEFTHSLQKKKNK